MDKAQITIFTDGSSQGNPGPGGYGVLILSEGKRKELSGGFRRTTNNRMELMAAIAGLEALPQPAQVRLYSDSQYLVKGMALGWARQWRAKGYRKKKNPDLWDRLLDLSDRHEVEFIYVAGHAGHPENERCDQLANAAAGRRGLPADEGYERSETDLHPPTLF